MVFVALDKPDGGKPTPVPPWKPVEAKDLRLQEYALKLMERAPERIVGAVICQAAGHWDEDPDVIYRYSQETWVNFKVFGISIASVG